MNMNNGALDQGWEKGWAGRTVALGAEKQKMDAGWSTHSTACINSGGRGHNFATLHWALDDPAQTLHWRAMGGLGTSQDNIGYIFTAWRGSEDKTRQGKRSH